MHIIDMTGDSGAGKVLDRMAFAAVADIDGRVQEIIGQVQSGGDKALTVLTHKFDGVLLDSFLVSGEEIEEAIREVGPEFLEILSQAKENIRQFHSRQLSSSWWHNQGNGITLGQMVTPVQRVGIYAPGGRAAYPSTVLMNAVPAEVAGVPSLAMVTPPDRGGRVNPAILAAARVAGIDEIYKVGGAQAIAALAYGTETIKPVSKIVGPGNIFVARAKRMVFGQVDIDMVAGPSEICIIADGNAKAEFIAADLLAQAEHDELACSILITPCRKLAETVRAETARQLKQLDRREVAGRALQAYGKIYVVNTLDQGFALANEIAPEHLEIMTADPFKNLSKVKNAGAVFLGDYSPEALGDYWAGPNHTLPTSGTAKFSSPLGVDDFIKRSSIIYYDKCALEPVKDKIIAFARREGLDGHGNSVKVRFKSWSP